MNNKKYQYVLRSVQILIQISEYQIQRLKIKQKIFFCNGSTSLF